MIRTFSLLAAACALLAACDDAATRAAQAQGEGDQSRGVWAAGSSTVAPFSSRVAENYARKTQNAAARVESLGTGGGIKLFCSGLGAGTPDIANASRPMKPSEWDDCRKNGVTEIVELQIGYDGVVIAGGREGADFDLTLTDVFRGLAAQVPGPDGRIVANPHETWAAVRADLPAQRIQVYGPPPTSGTRDAFVELGMHPGAESLPELAALKESDEDRYDEIAGRVREDGRWIDSGENDNAMVQTLTRTPGALGVFGYSFLRQNKDRVKPASIGGVVPTDTTIADGSFPLSRSLFIYVKKQHVGRIAGLQEYMREYVSDAAVGKGGYLGDAGLIPLRADGLERARRVAAELPVMARPAED